MPNQPVPPAHLARYNTYRNGGDANVSASRAAMTARLTADACAEWSPGKGADCARLEPVFDLLKLLPEP